MFVLSSAKTLFVGLFLRIWLLLEKGGLRLVRVPNIKPSEKTLQVLDLLREAYSEAEKRNIKVWLTGSWAITARIGYFFKNIDDIDFTMRTREEEKRFASLLEGLGLVRKGDSPMGATRYVDSSSKTEVDFGSTTYPGTDFYQMPLDEGETGHLDGFEFRIAPKQVSLDIYERILFDKGRSVKADLIKIKLLTLHDR